MARGKDSICIDLTGTLGILKERITEALCQSSFQSVRITERRRHWTLFRLVQFWIAIVLRAPVSLTHALEELRQGRELLLPAVRTSDEAFFQRCRDLRWQFFADVFHRFVEGLAGSAPPRFCRSLGGMRKRFRDVFVIDGSRLEHIARKLKILWDERAVILPGCLLGIYDLYRGIPRVLDFCADAAAAELTRAREALKRIRAGTLLVGDRLYCAGAFFEDLSQKGLWGVCRRNRGLGLHRIGGQPLRKKRCWGGRLTQWLVLAGSGQSVPTQRLRLIRFQAGKRVYELLTNVLDPDQLTGEEAMELYPERWSVERMYFDLKVVLNVNRFYAANPNAVAMQVYAAAMVYAALRLAQSEAAEQAGIDPEEISTAKFFPKMAAACHHFVMAEYGVAETIRANPGRRLRRPRWKGRNFTTVRLADIRVDERTGTRRRRRFCDARRQWKSFAHVAGGRMFVN